MPNTTLTVSQSDTGLTLHIPHDVLLRANLSLGSAVAVQARHDTLILTKQKSVKKYTLEEALPAFQASADGGELDWGTPQGKEIW